MSDSASVEWQDFFTGPVIKTDLLEVWLGKHGIEAKTAPIDPNADDLDLSREVRLQVPTTQFDRAWQLFYAEREDEI